MAAKHLKTFADLYSAVLEELKVQATSTTDLNRVKRDINIAYLDEVLPAHDWTWARARVDVQATSYLSTGTATVTQASQTITLSAAPAESQKGRLITIDGYAEVYRVKSHTAGATTLTLHSPYTDASGSGKSFKIYDDGIVLPVDCLEVLKVWHDHHSAPMEPQPDQKFLELQLNSQSREGRPYYYRETDFQDTTKFAAISGLPATATRSSSGLVRTIVFDTTVAELLEQGDLIEVTGAGSEAYNGEYIIDSVSTTTITYVGLTVLTESSTADTGITVKLEDTKDDTESYRKLEVYPSLYTKNTTIHIEYVRKLTALEDDADEPAMAITDRVVILYGALARAWSRVRNPEEAARNLALFQNKMAKMAGKIRVSTDFPELRVNELYLGAKRRRRRSSFSDF